ncbi:MAG: ABC-three component system protein [Candidatus Thiodiazotropha sp.]
MTDNTSDSIRIDLEEIPEPVASGQCNAAQVIHGRPIPPQQQILLYSADEWELFIEEWAHFQRTQYKQVFRLSGSADMGIDVAGLRDDVGLKGAWDNFQCKHYDNALTPGTAIPEIGKVLWHSFEGHYAAPQHYFFMAPKDCGMSLKKLLLNPEELKNKVIEKWDDWCAKSITSTKTIVLQGDFFDYVKNFDYSIFKFKTALDVIDEHRQTPFYATRFGGGLPGRPEVTPPPEDPAPGESRYLEQLLDAYGDNKKTTIENIVALSSWPDLEEHYHRQREFFYHAESLRNFARDTVPLGTFEGLQDEVHAGVKDLEASPHPDALARLNTVTQAAAQLPLTANGLISVVKVQDKRGICHQLANEDRLLWRKS